MSKAFKCNRCGKYYDHGGYDDYIKIEYRSLVHLREWDLCPECTTKFLEFMNELGRFDFDEDM